MEIFWWLLDLYLTFTYTDAAVISSYTTGREEIYTLMVLLTISTSLILVNYWILGGIVKMVKWMIKKIKKLLPGKRKKREERQSRTKVSKITKKLNEWVNEWVISKVRKHRYLSLFLLNLIPYALFLSHATIVATKWWKIRYGIFVILAGNGVKVYFVVTLVYLIGDFLKVPFKLL